jgi:hypothetical protein
MNDECPICRGIGWVCERHPYRPYDYEIGCACGYGAPCECNDSDPPDISHVTVIIEETMHSALCIAIDCALAPDCDTGDER